MRRTQLARAIAMIAFEMDQRKFQTKGFVSETQRLYYRQFEKQKEETKQEII